MKFFKAGIQLKFLYVLLGSAAASWFPVFPMYLGQNGVSSFQIGIMSSILPVVIFLVQPFWGFWADKYGRKWLLIIAFLMAAFCFAMYKSPASYIYLFSLTITMSVFWAAIQPLIDSLALDYISETNKSYSEFRMWGAIGWSASSWLLSLLRSDSTYLVYYRITAVILFTGCLIMLLFKKSKPVIKIESSTLTITNFKSTFTNKHLLLFLTIVFIHSLTATSIWNFEGLLLEKIGATQRIIHYAFAIQGICEIPIFFYADRIIKRFTLERTLLLSLFLTVLRLFLYGSAPSPIAILFYELIHGLTWSLFWVCSIEYVNNIVAPQWRASGQSFLWAVYGGIGAISGNLLTGYCLDIMPIKQIFLINSAILLVFTILFTPFLMKRKRVNYAHGFLTKDFNGK